MSLIESIQKTVRLLRSSEEEKENYFTRAQEIKEKKLKKILKSGIKYENHIKKNKKLNSSDRIEKILLNTSREKEKSANAIGKKKLNLKVKIAEKLINIDRINLKTDRVIQ